MYKKVLSNYKDRLINFSGRNQTLCRSKLYSARAFDIVRLNDLGIRQRFVNFSANRFISLFETIAKKYILSESL